MAAGLGCCPNPRPPGQIVAHQLRMRAGPTGKQVIRAAAVPRHQHRCQTLASFGETSHIGASPRQMFEEELVVSLRRQADRLAAFNGRGLARQLGRVLAFLDHRAAFQPGANVVAATLLERGEHLFGRLQLEDPGVLGLRGFAFDESALHQDVRKRCRRLGLESQLRNLRSARPVDKGIDRLGGGGNGTARHVRLAHRPDAAQLNARHRAGPKPDALDGPAGSRLHLAPAPGLKQRRRRSLPLEVAIPIDRASVHAISGAATDPTSRCPMSLTPLTTTLPLRLSSTDTDAF